MGIVTARGCSSWSKNISTRGATTPEQILVALESLRQKKVNEIARYYKKHGRSPHGDYLHRLDTCVSAELVDLLQLRIYSLHLDQPPQILELDEIIELLRPAQESAPPSSLW